MPSCAGHRRRSGEKFVLQTGILALVALGEGRLGNQITGGILIYG
jgi:hypothetical protein